MAGKILHIVIIEPSSVIYEGLYSILGNSEDYPNIGRIGSIDEIPNYSNHKLVDIFIINPGVVQNSIKAFTTLRNSYPLTKWIGIVYSYYEQTLLSVFDGCINLYDTPQSIINMVRSTADQRTDNEPEHQHEKLSEREIDVLKLLVTGNQNKEIADKLNISTHTVISHRKNISQKTGIKSVSGLTIYAVVKNIMTIESFKE
jgi:DNA-binding NarL/FixJ family response regulator